MNIPQKSIIFGCDPEFFFSQGGKIIGSEKVISENGLEYVTGEAFKRDGDFTTVGNGVSKIVRDGIQAELNPRPNGCRANLANEISCCFWKLKQCLGNDVKCDFSQLATVTDEEMSSLSEKSKQFGCSKSKNASDSKNEIAIKDASKYPFRSAGGHIHIGFKIGADIEKVHSDSDNIAKLLDIIVGNTCVLLDRNEGNIERRKVYGKAGEYRLAKHGLEYRTLSNFWLRSYQLFSFVMGMTRYAISVYFADKAQEFFDKVDYDMVKKAINENDFDLARDIFDRIKGLLPCDRSDSFPLIQSRLDKFDYVVEKGIENLFNHDILEHWVNLPEGHETGWETWIDNLIIE